MVSAIAGSLIWVRTPRWAVILFLFVSSLLSIRLNDTGPFSSVYVGAILIFQVLVLLVTVPFLIRRLRALDKKVLLLCFSVALFSFLSFIWSDYQSEVVQRSLLILIPSFGIFILAAADDNPGLTISRISSLILIIATILIVVSIFLSVYTAVFNYSDYFVEHVMTIGGVRVVQKVYGSGWPATFTSLTGNPNTFAAWLLLSVFALKWQRERFSISDAFYIIYLSIIIACLWLTFSLGVILSVLAFFLLDNFLVARKEPAKIFRVRYVIIGIALALCCVFIFRTQPNEFRLLEVFVEYNLGIEPELISEKLWGLVFQWCIFLMILFIGIFIGMHGPSTQEKTRFIIGICKNAVLLSVIFFVTASLVVFLPVFKVALYPHIFDEGVSERIDIWMSMLGVVGAHPFFGVGFGVSGEWASLLNEQNVGVFNSFFAILIEIGLIGFLLFVALLLLTLAGMRRAYVKAGQLAGTAFQINDRDRMRYLICILAALLVEQMFEVGLMRYDFLNFFIFAFLGLGSAFARKLEFG